jgi:uncharacterized membrane protein YidH (DUF202 family)
LSNHVTQEDMTDQPSTRQSNPDQISVELSSRRAGMSFQRTRMSAGRTLMSMIRTSLSLIKAQRFTGATGPYTDQHDTALGRCCGSTERSENAARHKRPNPSRTKG